MQSGRGSTAGSSLPYSHPSWRQCWVSSPVGSPRWDDSLSRCLSAWELLKICGIWCRRRKWMGFKICGVIFGIYIKYKSWDLILTTEFRCLKGTLEYINPWQLWVLGFLPLEYIMILHDSIILMYFIQYTHHWQKCSETAVRYQKQRRSISLHWLRSFWGGKAWCWKNGQCLSMQEDLSVYLNLLKVSLCT